ncbi:MAG: gamma-glutamyltransferase [Acidobacteria bacterium]|nr:gamma-glutamyltransferase [Acidobacteriota bacterium]MCA1649120.1 gamma-glutamyltransferase [Acidobacteriota bacterium]
MRHVILLTALLMVTPDPQQGPGDRPAANPRATRSVVLARNGIIATSQPLASAAGLRVLQQGGNAIDAAVTAAAVLAVVEPTMNGIGGDLFAIVYDAKTRTVRALNASGRAPAAATVDEFRRRNLDAIPYRGELSVSVPGVVDGWNELLSRHGTTPLGKALEPAVGYARDGFAVTEIIATQWKEAERVLARDPAAASTFLPGGHAPNPGDVFRNPRLAATLELIVKGGRDAFYRGAIARDIGADIERRKGLVAEADLAAHRSDWIQPISTTYRGYEVLELPPNTQGVVALEMLNILEGYDVAALGHNSAAYLHLLVEAKRIAFADRDAWLADADAVPPRALERMLSKDYAAERRREINMERSARDYKALALTGSAPGADDHPDARGDTIYLTAADREGNVVSLIQSIYESFGAGIVAGDTGIVLHNRGSLFSLKPGHPNLLAAGHRPFHTLVPAMVLKDKKPWLSFGVMGGDMQPQGHVQVLLNLIDFGMNVQEAGEAARFRHSAAGLALESAISPEARFGLDARGHRLITSIGAFGGFQGILIDPKTGVLMGGSDPRKDGGAIGY